MEADEAYVPLGGKGKKQVKPKRRGGRCTERKRPFSTLVERGSRKTLYLAGRNANSGTVASVLLRHVEPGSTVYTDEFSRLQAHKPARL